MACWPQALGVQRVRKSVPGAAETEPSRSKTPSEQTEHVFVSQKTGTSEV